MMRASCDRAVKRIRRLRGAGDTETIDVAASFDGSWCSRISARDGMVAGIAEETGQVLDAVFRTNACSHCEQLERQRDTGILSYLDYLWKYVYQPNIVVPSAPAPPDFLNLIISDSHV